MPSNTPLHVVDSGLLNAWPLPRPEEHDDKEARGRVLIVAGSREVPGAAVLAARAALRAGAGKVAIATDEALALAIGMAVPEAKVAGLAQGPDGHLAEGEMARLIALARQAAVVLVGPGLAEGPATQKLASELIRQCPDLPLILDAAAMPAVLSARPHKQLLVTPHAGEMAALCGAPKPEVAASAHQTAIDAARRWQAVVALKGSCTFVARPDGTAWRHESPNPGLGTAGSGDVLAGLMAGLAARGAALEQAAVWGVALHAEAGARLARRIGALGFLASELAAEVPGLMEAWQDGSEAMPVA